MSTVELSRALLRKLERPARYVGGEQNSIIKDLDAAAAAGKPLSRFAFCFPDVYEIGMSNMALRILYDILNRRDDIWCERVFAPWIDMESVMREKGMPLFSIESRTPLNEFDVVGFTLQYELSYSNVLNMLDLGGIPLLTADRGPEDPFVCGGGPVSFCCEPMADFFDFIMVGDGEEVIVETMDAIISGKKAGKSKEEILLDLAGIQGVYVPQFYDVTYKEDGTIDAIVPNREGVPARVTKAIVTDLDSVQYPEKMVVPNTGIVHDRVFLEVFRGCPRGCRFCQAGQVYRPVREKLPETLVDQAVRMVEASGYDELGLLSLSTSDYSCLPELADELLDQLEARHVSLSLPSLRLDNFSMDLMDRVTRTRKSGLTFAPEAGSQRLRDAINKGITEEDLLRACKVAFSGGYSGCKLYFMLGLPTETMEDVDGIAQLAYKITDVYRDTEVRGKKRRLEVVVSTSMFIPKPFTPFQWAPQDTVEMLHEKQDYLKEHIRSRAIRYNWHDAEVSQWEAILARGDRRLSAVLLAGHKRGQRFDAWDEHFHLDIWLEAMAEHGLDPAFYTTRARGKDEVFPWEVIDCGVTREFLWKEWEKAHEASLTIECRQVCNACGVQRFSCGICPTGTERKTPDQLTGWKLRPKEGRTNLSDGYEDPSTSVTATVPAEDPSTAATEGKEAADV